jgi:hypothetical protein
MSQITADLSLSKVHHYYIYQLSILLRVYGTANILFNPSTNIASEGT